ncbi:MAG: sugar ABC transporter ATP-binding protein [Sediminispirochaetaceae bacterium]
MHEPLLHVKTLTKTYPGVRALDGVDLCVQPGTVHGLVGENGAGKSTLIKSLAGVVKPDEMAVEMRGRPVEIRNASDARKAGLAFIHQELNLIEYFNAAENVFLGHEMPTTMGLYDRRKLKRKVQDIFDQLEVIVPLEDPVRYLAPGQRAMVAIARAFAHEADVYFMDEPATALTQKEKQHLFAMVRRITGHGKAVVYVTHNLDDVLELSQEITVFREGKKVSQWPASETDKRHLITAMIGEEPESIAGGIRREKSEKELFAAEGISGGGVGPVSFRVMEGEILGIAGLVGSGRSTLMKLLNGAVPAIAGRFRIGSRTVNPPRSPAEALGMGIALIPEERRTEGLALQRSVFENAILSSLGRFNRAGLLDFSGAKQAVQDAGSRVKLKTSSYEAPVSTLSGGNQQKVLFGRAVLARPKILLLDEPTKGVDVGARKEIYDVIRDLAANGVAVVIVSSDFEEILNLADCFVFIRDGADIGTIENNNLNQNQYLTLCYQGVTHE